MCSLYQKAYFMLKGALLVIGDNNLPPLGSNALVRATVDDVVFRTFTVYTFHCRDTDCCPATPFHPFLSFGDGYLGNHLTTTTSKVQQSLLVRVNNILVRSTLGVVSLKSPKGAQRGVPFPPIPLASPCQWPPTQKEETCTPRPLSTAPLSGKKNHALPQGFFLENPCFALFCRPKVWVVGQVPEGISWHLQE